MSNVLNVEALNKWRVGVESSQAELDHLHTEVMALWSRIKNYR